MTNQPDPARALQHNGLLTLVRMLGSSSPDATTFERQGVLASIVPASQTEPDANVVVFDSAEALWIALPDIARAYAAANVERWEVMSPDYDAAAGRVLRAAGYRVTDRLPAVVLNLADFKPLPLRGLDYDDQADVRTLGRINAAAYGRPDMATIFAHPPTEVAPRIYQARVGGEPAAVLCMIDVESNEGVDCAGSFVATHPAARHVGLAPRLLSAALADAKRRGCSTCSGQASQAGARVYSRMGFRTAFHYARFEREGA